jgi:hypothetical protein
VVERLSGEGEGLRLEVIGRKQEARLRLREQR